MKRLAMQRLAPIALAALFALPAGAAQAQAEEAGHAEHTVAGVQAAERWLALADAGKGADSWRQGAATFRQALTEEQWIATLQAVRAPYGAFKSRKLAHARYSATLPGAPAGEYVVVQFESVFAGRAGVTETVTPMREADGSWRVAGYFIR
jgi:hypothetical protein